MNTKSQLTPIRKRKITPLLLLGKVKKNNQIGSDRQSALTFISLEQRKINNRYAQIMNKKPSQIKMQSSSSISPLPQISHHNHHSADHINNVQRIDSNSSLSKIEQILRKTSRKIRYNTVHKKTKLESSPYLSVQRRRTENSQENNSSHSHGNQLGSMLKARLQNNIKYEKQQSIEHNNQIQQQLQRKLSIKQYNINKIFIHYNNLSHIDKILQNKKKQKQIITYVRKYVLQEEGDSSQIQNVYESEKTVEQVKKILFIEKILVIIIVDLIINVKFKLAELFIKGAIKTMIIFYTMVYKDLYEKNKIKKQDLADLEQESKNRLSQTQSSQKSKRTFKNIYESLLAKVKTCFKYSKTIQSFYKKYNQNLQTFSSNLAYFRLLQYYSFSLLGSNWASWSIDFLQTCPSPYLHNQPIKKYTLILDLDQTLIHYKLSNKNSFQGQFLIRPHMFQFLQQMSQYYQLGIFTCSMPQYAEIIINHMRQISFRLYRHHTIKINGEFVKDLSRVGRDLKYVILVDNLEQNFRLQRENGIHIRSWYGDRTDDMLSRVGKELIKLAKSQVEDFRYSNFERNFL